MKVVSRWFTFEKHWINRPDSLTLLSSVKNIHASSLFTFWVKSEPKHHKPVAVATTSCTLSFAPTFLQSIAADKTQWISQGQCATNSMKRKHFQRDSWRESVVNPRTVHQTLGFQAEYQLTLYGHLNLTHGLVYEKHIGINLCINTTLWVVGFCSAVFRKILC